MDWQLRQSAKGFIATKRRGGWIYGSDSHRGKTTGGHESGSIQASDEPTESPVAITGFLFGKATSQRSNLFRRRGKIGSLLWSTIGGRSDRQWRIVFQ